MKIQHLTILGILVLCPFFVYADEETNLSLMTFNIRYGSANDGDNCWSLRKDMVFDVIQDQNAVAVGLQEALDFQIEQIIAVVPDYDVLGVGRDDGETNGEYSAILYRPDRLIVLASGTFWLSDTPTVPGSITWGNACTRVCTWAHFRDKATEQCFYLFNTHLDHRSQSSQIKSVQLIVDRINQRWDLDPVFITGDFNAGENTRGVTTTLKSSTFGVDVNDTLINLNWVDSYRQLYPNATNVGTANNFTGTTSGEKIDYVWTPNNWEVLEAAIDHTNIDGRYPSDHYPVTATVRWP